MKNDKWCPVCGSTAVLKKMHTFEYYYCPDCKEDIEWLRKVKDEKFKRGDY